MDINIQIPEAFQELFEPRITGKKYTYKCFFGGRSSCKSHSFARALLIRGMEEPLRILCVREYYNSIADSVKALLDDIINKYELDYFYKSTKSEIIGKNGTLFLFGGLKINNKNIKGKEKIDIVWCEEAETISQESWDLLIPTIVRNINAEIWVSWNPYLDDDPVMKFVDSEREDIFSKKVTFRDNPFFNKNERRELEWCKKNDYEKYLWIWEGNPVAISDAVIFKGRFEVKDFTIPNDIVFYAGLDWGYTDPAVYTRIFINEEKKELYVDKAAFQTGLTPDEYANFLLRVDPDVKRQYITADSASPEHIQNLSKKGFYIYPAKKGPNSVLEGIEFMKNYKIIIRPQLKECIEEFSKYRYKVDTRTGQIQYGKIEDIFNHSIDSIRYALEEYNDRRDYKLSIPK